MSMTDPIADLLSRIRNAQTAKHDRLDVPASKLKLEVVKLLKEEGFIKNFREIEGVPVGTLRVFVRNGLGIGIVSTSQGLLTDAQARERRVGGELLCQVW
jgi:small subunit ribosomal protein S8